MRVWAAHTCPLFCSPASTSWGIVAARSASSRTMPADLPPSSRVHRLTSSPQVAPDAAPGGGAAGERDLVDQRVGDEVAPEVRVARQDADHARGTPASTSTSPSRNELTGASGDGFSMIGAPAASAAPSFMHVMNSGTFHGTMPAATPTGTFCTRTGPITPARSALNGKRLGQVGEPLEHHRRGQHLPEQGERRRRAHLVGDHGRQLVGPGLDALRHPADQLGPLVGRGGGPRPVEGRDRGVRGRVGRRRNPRPPDEQLAPFDHRNAVTGTLE